MTPLHVAAAEGDRSRVKELLDHGGNVNASDLLNNTPLVYAARNGHEDVAELLIAKGACVRWNNDRALCEAVKNRHAPVVELLLAKGANANAKGGMHDTTPLHIATRRNFREIMEKLMGKGSDVNARKTTGETPLHIAAENNNRGIVKMLILHGADVDARDEYGKTPLARAEETQKTYKEQAAKGIDTPSALLDYSSVIRLLKKRGGHD